MEQTKEQELFLAYEALLAKLEECKNNNELAIATRELQIFEMEYPELIEEYYYEKENEYNE